jgi:hypothetical protein
MEMRWVVAVAGMLLGAAPLPAQKVSLKDTQKAIRERILAEAGSDSLIYSRVDFNDCAVTIQTRTPRGAAGEETRTTYTFHATSLGSTTADPAGGGRVRLTTAQSLPSLRMVVQRIDSGRVKETVSSGSTMEFSFAQGATALTVARAFKRLVTVCQQTNPFNSGRK